MQGGGTQFSSGTKRRIYDKPRFRELSGLYDCLSKQFTILASTHIGCPSDADALLMLHRIALHPALLSRCRPPAPTLQGGTRRLTRRGSIPGICLPAVGPRAVCADLGTTPTAYFDKMTRTGW